MWNLPIGSKLKAWFKMFGTPGDNSSEEATIEDFSDLDIRLKAYDVREHARLREQVELEGRLKRLEIQSRRD